MGENLPPTGAEADQDLTPEFTLAELLDELGEFAGPGLRQPGDTDRWQLMAKYGKNQKAADYMMDKAGESGEWELVRVHDPDHHGIIRVLRKKT